MKTYIITVIMIVCASWVYAQKQSIRLIDAASNEPIDNATFMYGTQTGQSDSKGYIILDGAAGEVLHLSHINYGQVVLGGAPLKEAITTGQLSLQMEVADLMPVTVVSVRSAPNVSRRVDFSAHEHLSHDGASILKEIPAIGTIQKAGNYGFDPVFRGFKYDQLNVVLNGAQSATAACPNRMDPPTSQMAPNMLEQVEILKGPYSLRYGSGLGATINFKSQGLTFDREALYGRLSTSFESNGSVRRGEGMIGYGGKTVDVGVYSSYSEGNDYTSGDGQTVQADFQRGSVGTQLGIKVSEGQRVTLNVSYNMARDADFPALAMDLREDDTWMFNARHELDVDAGTIQSWQTTVFGSFVDHKMDNLLKKLDPRMLNAATDAHTFNYGARSELVWRHDKGLAYSGLDLKVEGAEGERTRAFLMGPMMGKTVVDNAWQEGVITKTGVFTEYHLLSTAYDIVLSGRLEINNATVNDPEEDFAAVNGALETTQVNPGVSLGIARSFLKDVTTSLWLGRVQRSGSLTERYINYFAVGNDPYELVGNPQLDPEANYQVDVSNQWTKEDFSLNVDLYASYLTNYISSVIDTTLSPVIPLSPGVRRFVNIDNAFKTGFEVGFAHQISGVLTHRLDAAYTYAQDLDRDDPLPETAPMDMRYKLMADLLDGRLRSEATVRHVLDQKRISEEYGETPTPAFTTLDVNVAYTIVRNATLNFRVQNLLDENYYEHLSRSVRGAPDPIFARGRSFNVSLFINLM